MSEKISVTQTRAHWWQRQALGGTAGAIANVIGASGWLRTLGGADVYIAARARRPGMKRSELDSAVERGELRVVPAARGCIYLVPSAIVPELMAFNAEDWRKDIEKNLAKIGKTTKVIEALAPTVLDALAKPLTTDGVRKQLDGKVPSFGEAGKKVGLSSPLPLALRMLEFAGDIERTLEGGKLDSDRYLWRKPTGKRKAASKTPFVRVVEAFLGYAGPATTAQIADWSGRSQRDVKAALDTLKATSISIEGIGDAWILANDVGALESAEPPRGIATLAFEDNYLVNHGLAAVASPKHHAIKLDIWGSSKPETIGDAEHVLSRTIVVDGLIAGFWEVDPKAKTGVWLTFEPANKALAKQLDAATHDTATFLLDEIGHARAYSLDSMELVQDRADKIKKRAKK
jgi:hypothetical protein